MAGNHRSGRRPLPTHLKVINGNPGHRPLNRAEPQPRRKIPRPPPELNEDGLLEWKRVVRELYNLGMLTTLDRAALAAYCQAYGRWIRAERAFGALAQNDSRYGGLIARTQQGNWIPNPLLHAANRAMSDMMKYAGEFGLTPSARSRIKTEGQIERDDPVAKYLT